MFLLFLYFSCIKSIIKLLTHVWSPNLSDACASLWHGRVWDSTSATYNHIRWKFRQHHTHRNHRGYTQGFYIRFWQKTKTSNWRKLCELTANKGEQCTHARDKGRTSDSGEGQELKPSLQLSVGSSRCQECTFGFVCCIFPHCVTALLSISGKHF